VNKRTAFTLIELLVVIAIIAILAAILFPVFAQAKVAAKGAAAISNAKQITLGNLIYASDTDDHFVPANNWDNSGNFSGYSSWVWAILPYMKNGDIMGAPPRPPIPVKTPLGFVIQAPITPTFGYNYTALSPYEGALPKDGPSPRSQSGLGKPAETVMLTGRFEAVSETSLGYSGYWYYQVGGPDTSAIVDPVDCGNTPSWCFDNWGIGSFWGDPNYVAIKTFEAGKLTGGVSFRASEKATVAWADGSVRKISPGGLAAGTNWTKTANSSSIAITDTEKYLWDDK